MGTQAERDLLTKLESASARVDAAGAPFRAQRRGERIPEAAVRELEDAEDEMREVQRDLAAERGEDFARPIDLGVTPSLSGVTLEHLIQDGWDAHLAFLADRTGLPAEAEGREVLAIVHLSGVAWTRSGWPNDEATRGHPLYERGYSGLGSSRWLAGAGNASCSLETQSHFL